MLESIWKIPKDSNCLSVVVAQCKRKRWREVVTTLKVGKYAFAISVIERTRNEVPMLQQ